MAKHDFLEKTLIKLAKLQIHLNQKGGPSEDGQLFEQILSLQEDILKSFGLPISPNYEKLVWFKTVPTSNEIKERINQLHLAATEYLLSDAKSELQILREAQQSQSDTMYVLPELKITQHAYTKFVFDKILLKGKDSVENVLNDLRFCNQPEILNALGKIHYGTTEHDHEIVAFLDTVGVKYLQQFIIHNSNLLDDDIY